MSSGCNLIFSSVFSQLTDATLHSQQRKEEKKERKLRHHHHTHSLPWIDGCYNPFLVPKGLITGVLQAQVTSTTTEENGESTDEEFCVRRENNVQIAHRMHYDAHEKEKEEDQEEEDMLVVGNNNHEKRKEEILETCRLVAVLKTCADEKSLHKGIGIHAHIVKSGLLEKNIFLGNTLVNMYAKCGAMATAQEVFDNLPARSVVSWNVLIAGYAQQWHADKALKCFEQMQLDGLSPSSLTYVCTLKACANVGAADKGENIHAQIVKDKLLEEDIVVSTALVDMYAKCGLLAKAQETYENFPIRNVVSWNALIAGYAQHGHCEEALNCFERMQLEGLSPDAFTFACILKVCGSIGAADKGQEIHLEIIQEGLLDKDIVVGTALVDMYIKCGRLGQAQEVFDKLSVRNAVLWNALLAGYAQQGHDEEALKCFKQMQLEGFSPDAFTCVGILKVCGSTECAVKGQEIHARIIREGLLEKDVVAANALIDMYAKCGLLEKASKLFHELPMRNVVSWNVLIAGYVQHGHGEEAGGCLKLMQLDGLSPDAITFACILKACSSMGAAYKGQEIHVEIILKALLEKDVAVINSLIGMYANCGMLGEAQEVFDNLSVRNIVSWNALIGGYAQVGNAETVFDSFEKMIVEGIEPDSVTFTIVLNTCSHRGLLNKGQVYFESMSTSYDIVPTLEHHTCMVDLFGRAGHVEKAIAVTKAMPFSSKFMVWHVVLGACRKWEHMKLGSLAFKHVAQLDEDDASAYVSMSDLYASCS